MKKYLFIGLGFLLLSCNNSEVKDEKKTDERTELFVKEPLKSTLDSLIAIDTDKDVIPEICVQLYDAFKYRIVIISRSYSLDKKYGKPLNYFISNGRKIDIYTGLEFFFQPKDTIPIKEEIPVTTYKDFIRYRVIDFDLNPRSGTIEDLKIREVPEYIPFLEIASNYKTE